MVKLTNKQLVALFSIYCYLYNDEEKSWQELDRPKKHIFHAIKAIEPLAKHYSNQQARRVRNEG